MRRPLLWFITLAALTLVTIPACQGQAPDRTTARIQKEVLHELTMLPFLTVFDNLAFKVEGDKVVLLGQVVNPVNKTDAGKAVKGIEGVEQVDNQIEVLPVSLMDTRLRRALYRHLRLRAAAEVRHGGDQAHPDHREEWARDSRGHC